MEYVAVFAAASLWGLVGPPMGGITCAGSGHESGRSELARGRRTGDDMGGAPCNGDGRRARGRADVSHTRERLALSCDGCTPTSAFPRVQRRPIPARAPIRSSTRLAPREGRCPRSADGSSGREAALARPGYPRSARCGADRRARFVGIANVSTLDMLNRTYTHLKDLHHIVCHREASEWPHPGAPRRLLTSGWVAPAGRELARRQEGTIVGCLCAQTHIHRQKPLDLSGDRAHERPAPRAIVSHFAQTSCYACQAFKHVGTAPQRGCANGTKKGARRRSNPVRAQFIQDEWHSRLQPCVGDDAAAELRRVGPVCQ